VASITISLVAGCGAAEGPSAPGASAEVPAGTPTLVPTSTTAPTVAPTPSATAVPTEAPSESPAPTPAATPGAPKADPATSLAIRAPFELDELDEATSAAVEAAFEASLGNMASVVEIGVRQVTRKGAVVGIVMVVRIPNVPTSSVKAFIDGAAGSLTGKVSRVRIAGHDVRIGMNAAQWAALTDYDGGLLMVITPTKKTVTEVLTALLRATG